MPGSQCENRVLQEHHYLQTTAGAPRGQLLWPQDLVGWPGRDAGAQGSPRLAQMVVEPGPQPRAASWARMLKKQRVWLSGSGPPPLEPPPTSQLREGRGSPRTRSCTGQRRSLALRKGGHGADCAEKPGAAAIPSPGSGSNAGFSGRSLRQSSASPQPASRPRGHHGAGEGRSVSGVGPSPGSAARLSL